MNKCYCRCFPFGELWDPCLGLRSLLNDGFMICASVFQLKKIKAWVSSYLLKKQGGGLSSEDLAVTS